MSINKESVDAGISIIIPNYNGKLLLSECLSSIFDQKIDFKYEILIIDNGSNDGSEQLIQNINPEIKFIKLGRNYGFAKAVNFGIKNSKFEYILLLNNDTVLEGTFLQIMKKALDDNPQISFCASRILMYENPDKIYGTGNIYINNGTAELRGFDKDKNLFNNNEFVFGACAAASIYRRVLFDNIGYFDEDFFAYYEDVDFDVRAQLTGHKCLYVADALVYHHGSVTSNKMNDFKIYYGCRNILLVMFKNMPLRFFLKNFINIFFLQM
ncbi:MAG: glycosyltransferase family 2 protein [Spirochaetes bacterium]|nr:glycosyltransferase family 2 protein [Spirochaetota bacterium]